MTTLLKNKIISVSINTGILLSLVVGTFVWAHSQQTQQPSQTPQEHDLVTTGKAANITIVTPITATNPKLIFFDKEFRELGYCLPAPDYNIDHPHFSSCYFEVSDAEIISDILQGFRAQQLEDEHLHAKILDYLKMIDDNENKLIPQCPAIKAQRKKLANTSHAVLSKPETKKK